VIDSFKRPFAMKVRATKAVYALQRGIANPKMALAAAFQQTGFTNERRPIHAQYRDELCRLDFGYPCFRYKTFSRSPRFRALSVVLVA
jgi:hypothetical protein